MIYDDLNTHASTYQGEVTEEIEVIMLSNDALQKHANSLEGPPDAQPALVGD